MANKFNLDGFSVDTDNICTADGFVGDLTGDVTGNVTGDLVGDVTGETVSAFNNLESNGMMVMNNLPTSDPSSAGQIWNDSGTLKISAG